MSFDILSQMITPKKLRRLADEMKLSLSTIQSIELCKSIINDTELLKINDQFIDRLKKSLSKSLTNTTKCDDGVILCVVDVGVSSIAEASLVHIGLLSVVRAREGESDISWIKRGLDSGATCVLSADVGALRVAANLGLVPIRLPQAKKGIEVLNYIKKQLIKNYTKTIK